ncbi:DUF3558 family protein [Saccharopolyspora griseoalba]|uniref:DUF3558 family protein n=1 Tax=Saccharopolyspora griseoalba TaxID=1431848 RepID=A0ABW2LN98_9PSEU
MKTVTRALIAATAGVALFGISACSGSDSGDTAGEPKPQGKAISSFDPCTFFKPDELTSWGVSTQSEDFTQVSFQPGCTWEGEKMDIALQKNADETVQSLKEGESYDSYEPISVGGREAARMIVPGATGQGGCVTVVSTGGGVVLYQIAGAMRDSVADPCAEIEKIANQTASRLPK